MVGISVVVLLSVALMIVLIEGINIWSGVILLTIVALVSIAIVLVLRAQREMRKGFPLQDERSITLSLKAGNRAFYVSMYLILFMAAAFLALEDRGFEFSNSELLFFVVAIMGSIHIVLSTYYSRKGKRSSE